MYSIYRMKAAKSQSPLIGLGVISGTRPLKGHVYGNNTILKILGIDYYFLIVLRVIQLQRNWTLTYGYKLRNLGFAHITLLCRLLANLLKDMSKVIRRELIKKNLVLSKMIEGKRYCWISGEGRLVAGLI